MSGIALPEDNELDELTKFITGDRSSLFEEIKNPDIRIQILNLWAALDRADTDRRISEDLGKIANWFDKSRLWEGH